MPEARRPTLIAISIKSIQIEPYIAPNFQFCKSATIEGESRNREFCFTMKTGLLNPEQLRRCELLEQHGFTVVEAPDTHGHHGPGGWQEEAVIRAMNRIAKRYENSEGVKPVEAYDPEFARTVLEQVNKHFPHPVHAHELKANFPHEPSDDALFIALAGLQKEGFIDCKVMFDYHSHPRKIADIANIEMTAEGRNHLAGGSKLQQSPGTHIEISDSTFHNSPIGIGNDIVQTINTSTASLEDLFKAFRGEVTKLAIAGSQQAEILSRLDDLEAAKGSPAVGVKYTQLLSAISDHITVFGYLLPPLMKALTQ
jgi:hypothetical protein